MNYRKMTMPVRFREPACSLVVLDCKFDCIICPAMLRQARYDTQLSEFKREVEKDVLTERRARAMKEGENIRCDAQINSPVVPTSCLLRS